MESTKREQIVNKNISVDKKATKSNLLTVCSKTVDRLTNSKSNRCRGKSTKQQKSGVFPAFFPQLQIHKHQIID